MQFRRSLEANGFTRVADASFLDTYYEIADGKYTLTTQDAWLRFRNYDGWQARNSEWQLKVRSPSDKKERAHDDDAASTTGAAQRDYTTAYVEYVGLVDVIGALVRLLPSATLAAGEGGGGAASSSSSSPLLPPPVVVFPRASPFACIGSHRESWVKSSSCGGGSSGRRIGSVVTVVIDSADYDEGAARIGEVELCCEMKAGDPEGDASATAKAKEEILLVGEQLGIDFNSDVDGKVARFMRRYCKAQFDECTKTGAC